MQGTRAGELQGSPHGVQVHGFQQFSSSCFGQHLKDNDNDNDSRPYALGIGLDKG